MCISTFGSPCPHALACGQGEERHYRTQIASAMIQVTQAVAMNLALVSEMLACITNPKKLLN